jgi:hypothetical protein
MLGVIEATVEGDEEKNRLCPPLAYWDENEDYLKAFFATLVGGRARSAHPAIAGWNKASRINPVSGIASHRDDPRVIDAHERMRRHGADAAANLARLVEERSRG